jgi:hypothetical protein
MSDELWFFGQLAAMELSAQLARLTGVRHRVTMTEGKGPNGERWKVVPVDRARPAPADWAAQDWGLEARGRSVRQSRPAWLCTTR